MSHRKYGLDHLGCRTARRLVSPALALWLCSQPFAARADLYFNPRFLADDPAAVADLSGFEKGQEVPPGTYRVDIYLNNGFMTTRDVTFQADAQGHGLSPCLTRGQLASMGVDTGRVPGMATLDSTACVPLTTLISEATTRFDVGQQRLYLTVPQAFMGNHARGYIPPELWDNGITAGLINYNFTGNNAHNTTGGSSRYAYLNLQSGLNIGAWRLRDNSTWSYSSGGSTSSNENRWQHVNSWLERDITPLRSRLTLGDSYTNGDVFDGINFRGAQLASDDNMLPDSQKGFAPVIHGIARGTAQVSIRQNGYEIYQSTVPPGPFTIDDLYAAGNGGDLQVTIKEADGSRQVFSVPWSTVPVLQREGHTRFALTAGEYRSGNSQQETPDFFQGTAMHGLPAGWTLYGGTQLADRYRAFNLGVGKNMGYFGALSLDITQANATLADDSEHQGQSVRFLYNKSLDETGTNLQLVGYRYSTRGYYNFADTTYRRMSGYSVETQDGVIQVKPKFTDYYNLAYSKRGKVQLSVTQQLGRTATLYLSGSHQTYWGTDDADEQLQAGARILDVNVGASLVAETMLLPDLVQRLVSRVDVPLSLDSSNAQAIARALPYCPGSFLVNSISGEAGRMELLGPVCRDFGAPFILLPLQGTKLPVRASERIAIVEKLLEQADSLGTPRRLVMVDILALSVSSKPEGALQCLEMVRWCRSQGLATTLGLSNVSFGLPARDLLNATFMAMCAGAGLSSCIANPSAPRLHEACDAVAVLQGSDSNAGSFIASYAGWKASGGVVRAGKGPGAAAETLGDAVLFGDLENVLPLLEKELAAGAEPFALVQDVLIPAITEVGTRYERREYFLPQLIRAAETMQKAFAHLKPLLEKSRGPEERPVIVMATVEGDIHDIGKNIVCLLLGNHGFDVIDAGKDVPAEQIVACALEHKARIIGLSALMTTTMVRMEDTIRLVRERNLPIKVLVGGAAVTQAFADAIGADAYCEDAVSAVRAAKQFVTG